MEKGKLIAGVAIGAAIALLLIPKTRHMITDAITNLAGSLKDMACTAEELSEKAKKMAVS